MPLHLINILFPAHDDPSLRSSQEFIPAERDHIRSAFDRLLHHRLMGQSVFCQVDEHAAPQILDHRKPGLFPQGSQFLQRSLLSIAYDPVVARMDFQECLCLFANGLSVIFGTGPVRCPDLTKKGTSEFHDLRNAESAPDLHQFSPGYDHLSAGGKGTQDKQHCRRIIIDSQRSLRSGDTAHFLLKIHAAFPSLSCLQVKFQVRVSAGDCRSMSEHLFSKRRSAKPGVEDDPGAVHNGSQVHPHFFPQIFHDPLHSTLPDLLLRFLPDLIPDFLPDLILNFLPGPIPDLLAEFVQGPPHDTEYTVISILPYRFSDLFLFHQAVHPRDQPADIPFPYLIIADFLLFQAVLSFYPVMKGQQQGVLFFCTPCCRRTS